MVLWVGDDTNTPSIILAYMKFQCSQVSYFKTEKILLVAQITTCWSHRIDWDSWMMHFICTFHQTFNKGLIPENSFKNSIKIALFIFAMIFKNITTIWRILEGQNRFEIHILVDKGNNNIVTFNSSMMPLGNTECPGK